MPIPLISADEISTRDTDWLTFLALKLKSGEIPKTRLCLQFNDKKTWELQIPRLTLADPAINSLFTITPQEFIALQLLAENRMRLNGSIYFDLQKPSKIANDKSMLQIIDQLFSQIQMAIVIRNGFNDELYTNMTSEQRQILQTYLDDQQLEIDIVMETLAQDQMQIGPNTINYLSQNILAQIHKDPSVPTQSQAQIQIETLNQMCELYTKVFALSKELLQDY